MDHLPDSPAIEPLSKRLRLTLERPPPTSDPVTGEPRILFDYGEQGEPIWQTYVVRHRLDLSPASHMPPPSTLLCLSHYQLIL